MEKVLKQPGAKPGGSSRSKTRRLAIAGMMIAITLIMSYTPLGIIPLQPVSATITHVPTIVLAVLEGPVLGAVSGLAFGLVSLFKALTAPAGVLDPYFVNPLVSVLPRILIGLITGWAYKGLKQVVRKEGVSVAVSAVVGSFTNTLGSMGMLYVLYLSQLSAALGENAGPVIGGIITTYGVMEAVAAAVITTVVVLALKKAVYR